MSKIIIDIPDCYPRVDGVVEIYGVSAAGEKLPYQHFVLDRPLLPGDEIKVSFCHD